jgi:hypothetical protein
MNLICAQVYGDWIQQPWTHEAEVVDALAQHQGWHPTVGSLIDARPKTFIWMLRNRATCVRWRW